MSWSLHKLTGNRVLKKVWEPIYVFGRKEVVNYAEIYYLDDTPITKQEYEELYKERL
jgi:hypothetical protein